MFTKRKHVGSLHGYKKVIDWDAVFGAIFVVGVGIIILANL